MAQKKICDIAVVGGGAAGITAAITAKDAGADVVLLEKNPFVGKKILSTGNGRCNFTNAVMDEDKYFSDDRSGLRKLLASFQTEQAVLFFRRLGIVARKTPDGYYYPISNRAKDVRSCLENALRMRSIPVMTDTSVRKIKKAPVSAAKAATDTGHEGGYVIQTVSGDTKKELYAKTVILATGGMAAPKSGSTGDGYYFARGLGHSVIAPHPALVKLICEDKCLSALSGLRARADVRLLIDGQICCHEYGEVQFNRDGLSGIPVMSQSRLATVALDRKQSVRLLLNLFPEDLSEDEQRLLLEELLFTSGHGKTVPEALGGLLAEELISVVLKKADLSKAWAQTAASDLSKTEVDRLFFVMEELPFTVTGSKGFDAAQTTAGGIPLQEVDWDTLESKFSPGLYFCGEVLDVDGICGGYNLHFAWAGGVCAGSAAAKRAVQ